MRQLPGPNSFHCENCKRHLMQSEIRCEILGESASRMGYRHWCPFCGKLLFVDLQDILPSDVETACSALREFLNREADAHELLNGVLSGGERLNFEVLLAASLERLGY
jgi:hypothetical protein